MPTMPPSNGLIRCPAHAEELTANEARTLIIELVRRLNAAEGRDGLDAYLTHGELASEV